jgi:hypothetical protein
VTGTGLYTTWVRVGVTTQAVRLLPAPAAASGQAEWTQFHQDSPLMSDSLQHAPHTG